MSKYLLLLFFPLSVLAFNPVISEPVSPNEPIQLTEDPFIEQHLLGDLEQNPDLYELTTESSFTLTTQLRQRAVSEPIPFRLIIIRLNENNGGVTEITRQTIDPALWSQERNLSLGMSFLEAPVLTEELMPGTYRIEVSTPDNEGAYMLVMGDEPVFRGPLGRFLDVFVIQHHFGVFPLFALLSPFVLIPLLALLATVVWLKRRWDRVNV